MSVRTYCQKGGEQPAAYLRRRRFEPNSRRSN